MTPPPHARFDLQGHRGARGLKPENTLPGFETAFDAGVSAVETDLHLSRDGVVVVIHDAVLSERLCRLLPGSGLLLPSGSLCLCCQWCCDQSGDEGKRTGGKQ